MALTLRWVGEQDLDRVAETRMLCYAAARKDLPRFKEGIREDRRGKVGDYLLAELDGQAVGTTTSLSLAMWMRAARFTCQGVAFVGTIKTARRRGTSAGEGIATHLMKETVRKARQRQEPLTALMPFRASYYQHFGYGIVERRCDWVVPLSVLPAGSADSVRYFRPEDLPALQASHQRTVEHGQCDIEKSETSWHLHAKQWDEGFVLVDAPQPGQVRGWAHFVDQKQDGKSIVRVADCAYESVESLLRLLSTFASLRDQYSTLRITLPIDLPLNHVLKEPQVPHRPVEHATAVVQPFTRMQLRILDHKMVLEGLKLNETRRGSVTVAIRETEGDLVKCKLDLEGGRMSVSRTESSPQFECPDHVWAAVVSGDLPATTALRLGRATGEERAANVLNVFAEGPTPFCREYF